MTINNENYREILNEMYDKNTSFVGTVLLYDVNNDIYPYIAKDDYLKSENNQNDIIFTVLGLDSYDFCENIYGERPFHGVFPVPNVNKNRNLIRIAFALFEVCEKFNKTQSVKVPRLELTEMQNISFLHNSIKVDEIELHF